MNDLTFDINQKEFDEALRAIQRMRKEVDMSYIKSTMRRKAKPIVHQMIGLSHSTRISKVIGITTSKRKTSGGYIAVGVIKNDPNDFEDISSYGLSAILEYGTVERFRNVSAGGGVSTGRVSPVSSFLRKPWDQNINAVLNDTVELVTKRALNAFNR